MLGSNIQKALGDSSLIGAAPPYPFFFTVPILVYSPTTMFQKWNNWPISTQHNQEKKCLYNSDNRSVGGLGQTQMPPADIPLGAQLEYYSLQGRKGLEFRQQGWVVPRFIVPRKSSSLLRSQFLRLEIKSQLSHSAVL